MFSFDQLQWPPPGHWEDLEKLIKDVFRAEWNDFHAQRNGRLGQAQHGVDVFGQPASLPGWAGVQCKNKDLLIRATLTVEELREEVRKARSFRPPLQQYIIATTAPRDNRLQLEARKITDRHKQRGDFSVHIYGWDDIRELLSKHENVRAQYYGHASNVSGGNEQLLSSRTAPVGMETEASSSAADNVAVTVPLVLPAPAARALGILATSSFPLSEDIYARLFPDIDWKPALSTLIAAKAITRNPLALQVATRTRESLFPSPADAGPYLDAWIAALEPVRNDVVMALLLSLKYVERHECGKAVDALVGPAYGLDPGKWNELYSRVLQQFGHPQIVRRLSSEQRRAFFVAYGLCLVRGRAPSEALAWAARLRRASKRARDHWGVAQSSMLAGLAHQNCGDVEKAAEAYNQTIAYARRHRLPLLIGHALNNLALLKSASDPATAARLLEESTRFKQQAGDEQDRSGLMFGRGIMAADQGQPDEAYRWFARAEKLAARMDLRHGRALMLCNMGTALVDQGRPSRAIPLYKAAQKLAETEGFRDALMLALGGEANACFATNRFDRAHTCFLRLHQLRHEMGQNDPAVIALHHAGVCLLKQGNVHAARKVLGEALVEARTFGNLQWIHNCHWDLALTYMEENLDQVISSVRQAATAEEDEGRFRVAARLWESLATRLEDQPAESIEGALLRAVAALEREEGTIDERIRVLAALYECRWSSFAFEGALDSLCDIEQLARRSRRRETLCRALDQRGTCLQQLDRVTEAVTLHRQSLAIARRLPQTDLVEHCLNNLGEALRKTGRSAAAILAFREAETLARRRGDQESAIATAHNRALVLKDLGRPSQARRLLTRCRDSAADAALWHEYVRALHGLANHSWQMDRPDEAIEQYRLAYAEATKRDLKEQIGPIALNYANALRWKNRPKRAYKVMQAAEKHFLGYADAHNYLANLGTMAAETGNVAAAKDAYDRARAHALLLGDAAEVALASAALASLFEQEADYVRADAALGKALALEQPAQQRAELLIQRLGVLLKAGKERQATKVFSAIQRLTNTENLRADAVDAHMLVGDHYWDTGKSKIEAMKAYTAAFVQAVRIDLSLAVRTGMHALQRLLSLDAEGRLDEINHLESSLKNWLNRQAETKHASRAVAIILWPLRLARRSTIASSNGRGLSQRQMLAALQQELFG
jgi:hypothetical protein